MATVPGWKLHTVNGTRRAITPQGQDVSYNQYLNAQAQASGFTSHSQYRKFENENRKLIRGFRERSKPERREQLGLGGQGLLHLVNTFFESDIRDNKFKRRDRVAHGPHSRLADLLVTMGVRQPTAEYDVGETP